MSYVWLVSPFRKNKIKINHIANHQILLKAAKGTHPKATYQYIKRNRREIKKIEKRSLTVIA